MSSNGYLPAVALTAVQGKIRLANATAAAWGRLITTVRAETGLQLLISPDGGYRSYADQVRLTGTGYHGYTPGYSVHGWGTCVDIWNWSAPQVRDELPEIAARFGFKRTIMPSEPWHFQHDGGGGAGGGGIQSTISEEETMRARSKSSGTWYFIDPLGVTTIPTGASGSANHDRALAYNATFGSGWPELSSEQINVLLDDHAARQKTFFAKSAAASGLDLAAVKAGIARIEAEVAAIKAAETADAQAVAAVVVAALEPRFAAVHANIDDQPTEFKVTPA